MELKSDIIEDPKLITDASSIFYYNTIEQFKNNFNPKTMNRERFDVVFDVLKRKLYECLDEVYGNKETRIAVVIIGGKLYAGKLRKDAIENSL